MFYCIELTDCESHSPLLQPDFSEKTKLASCCSWVGREIESSDNKENNYILAGGKLVCQIITRKLLTWGEEALLPVWVVVEGPAVVPVLSVALVPARLDVRDVGEVGVSEGEVVAGHVDILAVCWHCKKWKVLLITSTSLFLVSGWIRMFF